jgi:methyl-accepting chemotaxis protein
VANEIKELAQASRGIQDVNDHGSQSSTTAGTVSSDIAEVNTSVQGIADSSGQVNHNSKDLSPMAQELQTLVGRFKI